MDGKKLAEALAKHALWLQRDPGGARAKLDHVILNRYDFRGADLRDISFREADLSYCDFAGANLFNANLSGATLRGVNFAGARLENADLSHADLREAIIEGADLTGTDIWRTNLFGAVIAPETLHRVLGCVVPKRG
jgi:uncharacterized protein YjbI with pentapeptide repeats